VTDAFTGNLENKYISVEEAREMSRKDWERKRERSIPDFVKGQISNYPYYRSIDPSTITQRWMRGLRNVGGDIRRGLGSIRQGVSNFAGNLRQGYSTQAGYNAARQARINQNRVLMRSNPKSIENLKINYARMGLNENQINQKVQNFQNVTNQMQHYNPTTQQYQSPAEHRAEKSFTIKSGPMKGQTGFRGGRARGGLASIWPR